MTLKENEMLNELSEAQNFVYDLAENLITQGVPASNTEGLDTLVPKVLLIDSVVAQSPYDEWQEGFNANWDSVIQNAPQTGVNPFLHIYSKVNSIRHIATFPTTATIVTYNPTTSIYRPVVLDANKNLFFEESDYFINDSDGMYYTCVIYKAVAGWGSNYFNTALPVVYSNTKICSGLYTDSLISLINTENSYLYPFLRGLDCYNPTVLYISAWLEHLTVSVYESSIGIERIDGSDTQMRLLKEFVENAPIITDFRLDRTRLMEPTISDDKLADWFYNDFFYNNFNGTTYGGSSGTTKQVIKFKINSNILLTGVYQLFYIPNCVYLDGTFTENQLNDATSAGIHRGFQTNAYTILQNFPMWTILEGASTGCLLPMNEQSNVNIYSQGRFDFFSTNLEPKYFCEFDENGIIEDPTKYFICNLPFETIAHTNIQVRFRDLTFKNNYTSAQQSDIQTYLTNKNWNLLW